MTLAHPALETITMNASFIRRAILPLALTSLFTSSNALALCYWKDAPSGELLYDIHLEPLFVPRDAPVGTVIRTASQMRTPNATGDILLCSVPVAGEYAEVNLLNSMKLFPGPLPVIPGIETDRVLETNIPGIGIHVGLGQQYAGGNQTRWIPLTPVSIPYKGYQDQPAGLPITTNYLDTLITVIKTGDIDSGPQYFLGEEIFTGNYTDVGRVLRANLHGTVTQAECSLRADVVSDTSVDLGEHKLETFNDEGSGTSPRPFHINLTKCTGGKAGVYVKLEVAKGATVIDADKGLFSLTPDPNSASGIGVQVLRADGETPAALGQELEMAQISPDPDDIRIDFSARYVKVAPVVTSGDAKSALSFTIYYK